MTSPNEDPIEVELEPLPDGWEAEGDYKVINSISPPIEREIFPVGPHYLEWARRKKYKISLEEEERLEKEKLAAAAASADSAKNEPDEVSEPEDEILLSRNPRDWKNQDHYAVLGLSRHRYRATEDQIKQAYRKKVLRHHPDKKAAGGGGDDDSFFKCIQKATDILLNPVRRRQWDSVDEAANVDPPSKMQLQNGGDFYKLWGEFFESEARFSRVQPVPPFGDENSSKQEVEQFYNFWYNFDSWRSFEYQDEEVMDDNENRDQKRHIERKNQNARKKKKTEDTARLRKSVDEALANDVRIKRFRKEEQASRMKKRLEKESQQKRSEVEAAEAKAEAERIKAEQEAIEKAARADQKKVKEAVKNMAKKNKRVIRAAPKEANYFVEGEPDPDQIIGVTTAVDLVVTKLDQAELMQLANSLQATEKKEATKAVFASQVHSLIESGRLREGDAKHLR